MNKNTKNVLSTKVIKLNFLEDNISFILEYSLSKVPTFIVW